MAGLNTACRLTFVVRTTVVVWPNTPARFEPLSPGTPAVVALSEGESALISATTTMPTPMPRIPPSNPIPIVSVRS